MGKRVQSDRGEIARLHITLQRRERWVCELFIGHRRPDLRQTSLALRGSPMSRIGSCGLSSVTGGLTDRGPLGR